MGRAGHGEEDGQKGIVKVGFDKWSQLDSVTRTKIMGTSDSEIVLMGIILSDSAIREMGTSKVSYIGTFHQYHSPVFPLSVPGFVVTPILTNLRGKFEKPLVVTVRIEAPNTGLIMANTVGNIGVVPDYVFTGSEVVDLPFPIAPLVFPSPGLFHVIVMIEGSEIGRRSLPVNSITAPTTPSKD